MAKQRLRVVYDGRDGGPHIDVDLDNALEKTLFRFGFKMWASGCDMVPPFERDLTFEREILGKEDPGALPTQSQESP